MNTPTVKTTGRGTGEPAQRLPQGPCAPDPLKLAAQLHAAFDGTEFPLRAAAAAHAAAAHAAAPGRTLTELIQLQELEMIDSACPGSYWCTGPVGDREILEPSETQDAVGRAGRWCISAAQPGAATSIVDTITPDVRAIIRLEDARFIDAAMHADARQMTTTHWPGHRLTSRSGRIPRREHNRAAAEPVDRHRAHGGVM